MHYPLDVMAGVCIGAAIALLGVSLLDHPVQALSERITQLARRGWPKKSTPDGTNANRFSGVDCEHRSIASASRRIMIVVNSAAACLLCFPDFGGSQS